MKTALLVGLVAPVFVASLADAGDATRGARMAGQWCTDCHVIGGSPGTVAPQTAQPGPPSLPTVAQSGISSDQLRAFLAHPHGQMPDLSLSRAEIDDLMAYIQSLR